MCLVAENPNADPQLIYVISGYQFQITDISEYVRL